MGKLLIFIHQRLLCQLDHAGSAQGFQLKFVSMIKKFSVTLFCSDNSVKKNWVSGVRGDH